MDILVLALFLSAPFFFALSGLFAVFLVGAIAELAIFRRTKPKPLNPNQSYQPRT